MKNRLKPTAKPWKIVPVALALLTIMLFSTAAFAQANVQVVQQDDGVDVIVTNGGDSSIYLLNAVTILDATGNIVYTSQDLSSAEVLRIRPGVSYTFTWNTATVADGSYTAKIYVGDTKKNLIASSIEILVQKKPGKPVFSTDKKTYQSGQNVDVTFTNKGFGTIFVNVNNWQIRNIDTNTVVGFLSQDCTFGYGSCADNFQALGFMGFVQLTWDQKDTGGNQVDPGDYIVTAEFSETNPPLVINTISTKKFVIKPPK